MSVAGENYRIGDDATGQYEPAIVNLPRFPRIDEDIIAVLKRYSGLSSTVSDALDDLGWQTVIPASVLPRRSGNGAVVVGQALTLLYLPERQQVLHRDRRLMPPRLAHKAVLAMARPGDVLVVDARGFGDISVFGGMAARAARQAGLAGCIIDGGVRDLAEIRDTGLSVWSRSVTPRTGKYRLEAVAINGPIACGGVQVRPGDLVVADETGICFIPLEVLDAIVRWVEEVAGREARLLAVEEERKKVP